MAKPAEETLEALRRRLTKLEAIKEGRLEEVISAIAETVYNPSELPNLMGGRLGQAGLGSAEDAGFDEAPTTTFRRPPPGDEEGGGEAG